MPKRSVKIAQLTLLQKYLNQPQNRTGEQELVWTTQQQQKSQTRKSLESLTSLGMETWELMMGPPIPP